MAATPHEADIADWMGMDVDMEARVLDQFGRPGRTTVMPGSGPARPSTSEAGQSR